MKSLTEGIYALALTLWVGGMWVTGLMVAPMLFHALPDRALFGAVAGRMFSLMAYTGIACAVYVLLFRLVRFGGGCFRHGIFWIVLTMLALTLVGEFGVQPVLASLKDQALPKEVMESVFRGRFAAWHGVASILYLIQCVLGLLLVWLQGRNPG
jgi:hypothetical protein